jgi:hypothetical protein
MGRLAALFAVCFILTVSVAGARTWVVLPDSTGDAPSIQAGIDSASVGDTVMVMTGTYYEHDIFIKSGTHLVSETGTRDCVTIDAENLGRVFACLHLSSATSITGFTATNGKRIDGGGMYCDYSDATFTECRFMYNSAVDTSRVVGGGVYLVHGSPVFTDCDFLWNSVECTAQHGIWDVGEGGGVYAYDDSPRFVRCVFSHNSVDCDCDAVGGGFACGWGCSPTLEECVFDSNSAGGVRLDANCAAIISGCTFRGNTGAPCCVGGGLISLSDDAIITDCLFEGNTGTDGAGITFIYVTPSVPISNCRFIDNIGSGVCVKTYSSITLTNCLFAGNHEPALPWGFGGGGVLVRRDAAVELVACTFYGNSTDKDGGGIYCGGDSYASLDHCIVSFSTDGEALYWDGTGTEPVLSCCDLYGNEGGDWVGDIADQYGINGNISVNPVFCNPFKDDYYLAAGSPCLDADTCGTIGAYGLGCSLTFSVLQIADHPDDYGGVVDIAWSRVRHDSAGSDTVVDYYSIWRRMDVPARMRSQALESDMHGLLADPPGTWERVDSVPASGEYHYTASCSTLCDSTETYGPCWSVFFIKAHCSTPVLEFSTEPDSAYSFSNVPMESWEDITSPPLGNSGWGQGFAWVDYDGDDDLDIFITNRTSENRLYRNEGLSPTGFVDVTPPELADPGDCRGAAWGDYDNDGDLDLYVTKNGANRLYRNDGGTSFTDVTASPLDDSGIGQTASWADYDNDGDLDLYLVNNGANRLFRNDGSGVFTAVTGGPLEDQNFGMGCGWADYDDDGDLDIYIANYDAANVLIENEGSDVFTDATTPVLGITAQSAGVAWGDYDNDLDLDLYVTNVGSNTMLRNDGGTFADATASPLADYRNGRSAAWGDYDLDGDLDLYVVNYAGENRLFQNSGGGAFVIPECAASCVADGGNGFSFGWGDYDKDGDLDIYTVKDGSNKFFQNNLYSERHWLEIRLVGVASNRYGQGARVRVVGGESQMRVIAGASGYVSQGPLTAFFGLGTEWNADTVEVVWPSGVTDVLTDVECDQSLEIVEGEQAEVTVNTETPKVLRLYPGQPNPFSGGTIIRFDLPEAALVDLTVFDVAGRSVRRIIERSPMPSGRHTATWNGRNADGRPVAPGIYFCRIEAADRMAMQRMVLLK